MTLVKKLGSNWKNSQIALWNRPSAEGRKIILKSNNVWKKQLMNNTTTLEPITKNGQQEQSSYFMIRNEGVYLAHFSVSYKLQGQDLSQDSGKFILAESRLISLPKGATDIYLKVELLSFLNSWSNLFTQFFPTPITKCYRIWGTILNPQCDEITCLSESSIFDKN